MTKYILISAVGATSINDLHGECYVQIGDNPEKLITEHDEYHDSECSFQALYKEGGAGLFELGNELDVKFRVEVVTKAIPMINQPKGKSR